MTDTSERFAPLLEAGESTERLDLSGWIVLRNMLQPDDEIIVEKCNLFDRDVRAVVRAISSNNLLAIDLVTEGAKDSNGHEWTEDGLGYWMDIMYHVHRVTRG